MKTYRAAIIGTGRIASTYDDEMSPRQDASFYEGDNRHAGMYVIGPVNHAAAYKSTPGFELVAAANHGKDKLDEFGRRWGVQALYTDFRELLRQERPDVVSVCTQSPQKAEVTFGAAEAGVKAIVIEKAMATSMMEADEMIAACKRHDVFLAVNHPYRFSPMVRRTRELIDQGAIGELGNVTVHASGGMMHIGTHTMDMLRYWAGDVVEVDARVPNYEPQKDLPAHGMLTFANGITGFFDHTHGGGQSLQAHGTGGYLTVSSMVGDGWLYRVGARDPDARRKYPSRLTMEPIEGEPHTMSLTQRMLSEVHRTLDRDEPFISTGRDGAAALELGLACYASHLAGGPVTLPLADRTLRVPNR